MKKIHIILSFCFLLLTMNANAQWQQISGPYGGKISCVVTCNSKIFAGGNGGVFVSSDNGINWLAVNNGLPAGTYVNALIVNGTTLFAGTNSGVYKSINDGLSWTDANNGLNNLNVLSLVVSGSYMFAGTYYGGVYLSIDGGVSWTAVNYGLKHTEITAMAIIGNIVYAGTWGGGVYLSSNYGSTWVTANTGIPSNTALGCKVVTSLLVNGTDLYVGLHQNGVYKSINNGASWSLAYLSGLTNLMLTSLATDGTNIYAGTNGGGVFMSANGITSWTAVSTGLTTLNSKYILTLACINGTIFAGTKDGIHTSINNGTTWTINNNGLSSLEFTSLLTNNNKIYAGTDNGVYMSADTGLTWLNLSKNVTTVNGQHIFSLTTNGSSLLAGTFGGVYISSTNDTVWTATNSGLSSLDVYSLKGNGTMIYAGTDDSLFLSANNGASWLGLNYGAVFPTINAIETNNYNIYMATIKGVYLSSNGGANWILPNIGLPLNTNVNSLVVNGTAVFAGTDHGVFVSNDNAVSWFAINNGLTDTLVMSLIHSGTYLIAGTYGGGVFISTNNGANWLPVNTGLALNTYISALTVEGNNLFIATSTGLFKRSFPEIFTPYEAGGIVGDTIVCKGTNVIYTVPKIIGATSYVWSLPLGFTGISDSSTIVVTVDSNAAPGHISVHGHNTFGNGAAASLFVNVNPIIAMPDSIMGSVNVCENQSSVVYTVNPIANATFYIWTLINSDTDTTATNSVTTGYGSGISSGTIMAKGNNKCGDGPNAILPISVHLPSTGSLNVGLCPGQIYNFGGINLTIPGIYTHHFTNSFGCDSLVTLNLVAAAKPVNATIIAGAPETCRGQNNVLYTIPTITNATSYIWTLPSGASGSSIKDSILISFGNTATSGYLQVYGHNVCGNGGPSLKAITVNADLPLQAGTITSTTAHNGDTVCKGTTVPYKTTAINGAATYNWYFSGAGVTILGNSNNINLSFSDTATSGILFVTGLNSCGEGLPSINFPITVFNCTGITETNMDDAYKLFPNPAKSETNMVYPQFTNSGSISVYNMLGQVVYYETLTKQSSYHKINMLPYQAGLYKVVLKEKELIKAKFNLIKN